MQDAGSALLAGFTDFVHFLCIDEVCSRHYIVVKQNLVPCLQMVDNTYLVDTIAFAVSLTPVVALTMLIIASVLEVRRRSR